MIAEKYNQINNVVDAKKACYTEEDCTMFYDVDSKGQNFGFCHIDHTVEDSVLNSTGYIKCKTANYRKIFSLNELLYIHFQINRKIFQNDILNKNNL